MVKELDFLHDRLVFTGIGFSLSHTEFTKLTNMKVNTIVRWLPICSLADFYPISSYHSKPNIRLLSGDIK